MPLAVDLFCGRGGWTRGLLAKGWDVVGFDLLPQPVYPREARFVQADVTQLDGRPWRGKVSLIVASPPCIEFAKASFPFTYDPPPDPESALALARHAWRLAEESGAWLVVENVRGAVPWLGPPVHRAGPFYLWGDVPILKPYLPKLTKDLKFGREQKKSKEKGKRGALAAEIPSALACWIAEVMLNFC